VPVERRNYRIGVPHKGRYKLVFNTDAAEFGGTDITETSFRSDSVPMHGHDNSITMTLAPLSVIYLRYVPVKKRDAKPKPAASAKKKTATAAKAAPTVKKAAPAAKKTAAKSKSTASAGAEKKTKTTAKKKTDVK